MRFGPYLTQAQAREVGFPRYTSGEVNPACGHHEPRYLSDARCVKCHLIRRYKEIAERPELERARRARLTEFYREYNRNWRIQHPDYWKEYNPAYRAANPEKAKAQDAKRRARHAAAPGFFTKEDIFAIRKFQEDNCAYFKLCGNDLSSGDHIDHVYSLSKGGSNWPENIQILCQNCNQRKYNHDPIYFVRLLMSEAA